jgi:uncharacterized protein YbjT (DUF2867 family)
VVRDLDKHRDLAVEGVSVTRGDVTDAGRIPSIVRGHDAAVEAVTPFSGSERGFADLDPNSSSRPPTLCFRA